MVRKIFLYLRTGIGINVMKTQNKCLTIGLIETTYPIEIIDNANSVPKHVLRDGMMHASLM